MLGFSQRTLFGVHKTNFMLLFVAGWWCYDYYSMLLASPAIQIYLSNLSLNPCFLDGEHMRQRQAIIAASCAEIRTLQANFTVASITIEDTLREVEHFTQTCRCNYPDAALAGTIFHCASCGGREVLQDGLQSPQPPQLLRENVSWPNFSVKVAGINSLTLAAFCAAWLGRAAFFQQAPLSL